MNTILNSLSEADKNKSFLTIYKDGADFDIKLSDFASAISAGSLKLLNGINLSASLTEVTDSIGTISPLQLSTTQVAMLGATFFGASSASTNTLTLQSTTRNQFKVPSGSTTEFWYSASAEGMRMDANGNLAIGTTALSARLHVKGDGTNPIARFESSAGTFGFIIGSSGNINPISGGESVEGITAGYNGGFMLGGGVGSWRKAGGLHNLLGSGYENGWEFTTTVNRLITGEAFNVKISQTFNGNNIGSALYRPLSINYTINNTAAQTGNATGLFLNATETALNGITHNLMDLQVGGVSAFQVTKNDAYIGIYGTSATKLYFNGTNGTRAFLGTTAFQMFLDMGSYNFTISRLGTNQITFTNTGNHILNLVAGSLTQFGGTTNLFPAIKRNGAAIDFKLADDSAPCAITAATFTQTAGDFSTIISGTNFSISTNGGTIVYSGVSRFNSNILVGSGSINGSAILQAESTTKGFLMPRMTQAQILLIATPAEGLQVYNTTISHLCIYQGGVWTKVNHSPM